MNTTLMKDYVFKVINKYVFVKKVYFDYTNERVYFDLLVYSQEYRSDIECLLDYMDSARFNEVAEQTIKEYLNQRGIFNYEEY